MLFAFLIAMCCQVNANIIFVQAGASGNGTSWESPMGELSSALAIATEGTQVWVAAGTYAPTQSGDRKASFVIPNGVSVYGGFSGIEASIEERNTTVNIATLTGEIGGAGILDNSFTVVVFNNANSNTVLDGFVISGGNADSAEGEGKMTRCGGAMYINGENGSSNPVIKNCIFKGNKGRDGAAVYNNGRNGSAKPVFESCVFENNEAGLDGGALYNDGRLNGESVPTLTDCTFTRNMGTYGGAICNATESGVCNLILNNCTFVENAAYLRGGAVFSLNGDQKCYLEMSGCQFSGNFPDDQNMVFTSNAGRSNAYQIAKSEAP